jgi:hypothetical protein
MALYVVKYGETLLDVCYNATGAITAIDQIMDANGFDTYTPTLYPGQVLTVPDVIYNSDAVHAANIRPFNNSCGIETDELHGMIDSVVDGMGDIPGPPDDPNIDPVEPEPGNINYLAIKYRLPEPKTNITVYVLADYAVASEVKCTLSMYHTDTPNIANQFTVSIKQGFQSSSEITIPYKGENRIQFIINGVIPIEDGIYSYQAGYPVEIIP